MSRYTDRYYGYNSWYTCYSVDSAVMRLGLMVESLLHDLDKDGKPKHTLESLFTHKTQQSKTDAKKRFIDFAKAQPKVTRRDS